MRSAFVRVGLWSLPYFYTKPLYYRKLAPFCSLTSPLAVEQTTEPVFLVKAQEEQPQELQHEEQEEQEQERQQEQQALLRSRVLAAVNKLISRKKSTQARLKSGAELREKAEALSKRAQLISGSLSKDVPTWASELTAMDWETGEKVQLSKDDKYASFHEEAKKLFVLARRMKRGSKVVCELLATNEEEVENLSLAALALEEGEPIESIKPELLRLGLVESVFTEPRTTAATPEEAPKPKLPYRLFEGPDGSKVLVGRNSRENDRLSTRIAKNEDTWMHSRNTAGAHVVIKAADSKKEPSRATLQLAANLAIFYSEARDMTKAVVLVAKAKHVVKFKGAPVGAVRVRKEESSIVGYPSEVPEECVLMRERFAVRDDPVERKDTRNRQKPLHRKEPSHK